MWLDEAYVSFGYADRIARGAGPFLLGQEVPTEYFSNPLWVALFGLVGGLNIRESDVQVPLSVLAYVGLIYLVVQAVREKASWPIAACSAALLGLAPVVAAVRDGTDAVCLAALSLWAVRAISQDIDRPSEGRQSACLLAVLSWTGLFGVVVALGLALVGVRRGRWRNLKIVVLMFGVLTAARLVLYSTWLPPMSGREWSVSAFSWFPVWSALALIGVVRCFRTERFLYAWVVLVGWGMALTGMVESTGFGVSIVPTVGAMAVLFAETWSWLRIKSLGYALVFAVLVVDARTSEMALEEVRTERLSHYLQNKGMGRFLLWRFAPEDSIVVHRPGVIGYYSRRPLIDLSGRIHDKPPSPQEALNLNPVAVLPERSIVSQKAQRLIMSSSWPQSLEKRYKQYAIQHQKAWQMVDINPVWFHIYIRKDLPMLRPEIPKSNGNILPRANPFGDP